MRVIIVAIGVARAAAFVPAPPEVAALHLKETLNKKGFVRIPGAEFRALLRWKGAREEDLQLIESGAVHADVATDEGAMAFRQSAAHRLVATGTATFVPAQRPAVPKIPAKEVLARRQARGDAAFTGPSRAGRVRRRGQGPVQAERQPRLAADAAGLRVVDGAGLCGYQASGAP